ncbi:hypothetical protein NK8_04990 [Caballeronia sp. NK8]|uniref:hypothetical protein n=1 Tax=Caballeronia sp. NK8 TaxID=140098 RepID=UPI001BB5DB2F|nr:hypothetical protein [Caballeronia sp. NK8]BCQ22390.1 hypothetical protein NK8_04990 [Caballeronia sp. NK8]
MNREFERRTERELVLNHLEHWEMPRTIVLYGPEGIGKHEFCDSLRKDFVEKRPKTVVVTIGCTPAMREDMVGVLLSIRTEVSKQARKQKCRPEFLAFDLALLEYYRQKQGEFEAEKLGDKLASLSDSVLRKLVAKSDAAFGVDYVTPAMGAAGAAAALAGAGAVGTLGVALIPVVLGALAKWGLPKLLEQVRALEAKAAYSGKPEASILRDVGGLSPEKIEKELPRLLAEDIRAFLIADGTFRLVFIFENFNRLWGGEALQIQPHRFPPDAPLQQLRRALTDALFVITDLTPAIWQEPLGDEASAVTANDICFCEFHPLSADAQRYFLLEQGITDPLLLNAITETTQGHRVWLQYLAERYQMLSADGQAVKPEQLRLSVKEIDGVLAPAPELVPPWLQEAVRRLSVCVWFDRDLFNFLVGADRGHFPIRFDVFSKMSYVQSSSDGTYAIHPVFRAPVLSSMAAQDPEQLQRLRNEVLAHLVSRSNLRSFVQASIEAYDTVWNLARGPNAAEAIAAYLKSPAFTAAFAASLGLRNWLTEHQQRLIDLQRTHERLEEAAAQLRKAYDPDEPVDYAEIFDAVWRRMRDGIVARFEYAPTRVEHEASALRASLSNRLVADMYHSLKLNGIDVPVNAIWPPAVAFGDVTHAERVRRLATVYSLIFGEIESTLDTEKFEYVTLREDLMKWHAALASPVERDDAKQLTVWNRTTYWSTFEANDAPPPPEALESVMSRFEQMLAEEEHPGARALLGLVGMGYVQPFADGADNETFGRLLMNKLLAIGGYQWVVVPSQNKEAYFAALSSACIEASDDIGAFICALLHDQSRVPGQAIASDPSASDWPDRLPSPC